MAHERQVIHPQHVLNVLIAGRASRGEHKAATQHIQRYLSLPKGEGPALDLMCGTGYGTAILHALGYDPLGVDRDAESIRDAKLVYCGCGFRVADARVWEPDRRFRLGVCFEGLEHLPNPAQVVPRMARWADEWYISIPVDCPNEFHLQIYKTRDMIRKLLASGFKSVRWLMPPGYWHCEGALT